MDFRIERLSWAAIYKWIILLRMTKKKKKRPWILKTQENFEILDLCIFFLNWLIENPMIWK